MRRNAAWVSVAVFVCALSLSVIAGAQQDAAPPPSTPVAASPGDVGTGTSPTVTVTEEMRSHQRWVDTLYFVGTLYGLIALVAILAFGLSRRMRDLAARVTGRTFLQGMLYFALFSVVLTILTLPMDWLSGYWVPHRFDLSDQGIGGWLWEQTKGLLVGIVIGAPLVALALRGIRRFRRWWFALWVGAIPVVLLLVLVGPVLLDPVFNDFKPLKDQQLKQELLDLASRAGIEGGRVYEVDKSKQTKTMNAYVNGIGPTKRIVLWDTIIAKMDHQELEFVMAHEMGHYVLHHIWVGLAFTLGVLLLVFWVGQRMVEGATRRWGHAWGFETAHDPAAIPLLLAAITVVSFVLTPVFNGFSRHMEHQADLFALELTHLNDAGARAFVKFAEDSKVLPDPPAFIRFWRYSHPTLAERIVTCRDYHPWTEGKPNQVWLGGSSPTRP